MLIYKITNKINNKCYIGSSIRVEKRWKEHINASKNPNNPQYNYPLYSAFRKYGIENFTFEILKDDFNSIKGDNRYSIVKGYIIRELDLYGNIIENNISIQDRIDEYNLHNPLINGERHSISEWSKIYNIARQTVMNRIKNGMDIVEAITTPTRR